MRRFKKILQRLFWCVEWADRWWRFGLWLGVPSVIAPVYYHVSSLPLPFKFLFVLWAITGVLYLIHGIVLLAPWLKDKAGLNPNPAQISKDNQKISVNLFATRMRTVAGGKTYEIGMLAEIYNRGSRPITIRSHLTVKGEERAINHENIPGQIELELFVEPGRNVKRLLIACYPFNPSNLKAHLKCYEIDGTEVCSNVYRLPVYTEDKTNPLHIINDLRKYWKLYFTLVEEVITEIKTYGLPLPAEWTTEKGQKLKEYLAEIDKMCLSLKINRRRLYFFKNKWRDSDGSPNYYFIDIDSVDNILEHYKFAQSYNTLEEIQQTLRDSYDKFLDELADLETLTSIKKKTR